MDSSFDVPDPSDWLETPVSQLAPVEQALRCQVCKDFFDTPMISSCSHTFCSLCIRRCLTNDGRCPTCRAQDQEMKLRPNSIVQELVEAFQTARPVILQLGKDAKASRDSDGRGKKRKVDDTDFEEDEEDEGVESTNSGRRNTRSQCQSPSTSHEMIMAQAVDDDKDGDFQPDDGLIACPICNARMKEEAVFSHLDVHDKPDPVAQAQAQTARKSSSFDMVSRSSQPPKAMERLPQLSYSLLKDNALRKKLSDLGIPNGGPRALLIRRHREWINLVNANCDSRRPRTKRELLHELDVWDKTQGRQILNSSSGGGSSSSVMNKDFDGAAWAASHDNEFQSLIARARGKAKAKTEDAGGTDQPDVPAPGHASGNGSRPDESSLSKAHTEGTNHLPLPNGVNDHLSPNDQAPPMQASFVDLEAEG